MSEYKKKKQTEPWKPKKIEKPVAKPKKKDELKEHTAHTKIVQPEPIVCEPEAIQKAAVTVDDIGYFIPPIKQVKPLSTMDILKAAKVATMRDKRIYRMTGGRRGAK